MRDNIISFNLPAQEWLRRARAAMEEREFLIATRYYRKAMDLLCHPVICLEMAYAYFSLHSYETVEHLVWEHLQTGPLDGEWCYLAALCAVNQGHHDMAQDALRAYLFLDPMGDHRKSAASMLTHFPWKNQTPPHAARAYTLLKRKGSSLDVLLHAQRRDPTGRCAARCASLLAGTNAAESLRFVHIAQQKGVPEDCLTEVQLASMEAYHALGYAAESHVAWERAGAGCTEMSHVDSMVQSAIRIGRFDWARELLDAWMHHVPCAAHILRLYALLLEKEGKKSESAVMLRRLFYVDPWHPLRTQSYEETEQTLLKKRSMIYERIRPLCLSDEEGGTEQ